MQERENAIVQLEVRDQVQVQLDQPADPLLEEQNAEMQQLERDITDMAECFTEIHKLVNDQGEKIGKANQNPKPKNRKKFHSPPPTKKYNFRDSPLFRRQNFWQKSFVEKSCVCDANHFERELCEKWSKKHLAENDVPPSDCTFEQKHIRVKRYSTILIFEHFSGRYSRRKHDLQRSGLNGPRPGRNYW